MDDQHVDEMTLLDVGVDWLATYSTSVPSGREFIHLNGTQSEEPTRQ